MLSELCFFFAGMFAMGIIWFINDGKHGPYQRGLRDGFDIGKKEAEMKGEEEHDYR